MHRQILNTMMTTQMYDAQASSIRIDDITTNDNNRLMLSRIKRNSAYDDTELHIQNQHDVDGEDCVDYVPEGAYAMGWLGYFIGKSEHLNELIFRSFTPTSGASLTGTLEPFIMGLNRNKSITSLSFIHMDLLGGRALIFSMMCPFFENCPTLVELYMDECQLENDGWRLLALAIGSSKSKSLQKVCLTDCNISDKGSVDIITSLSMHPNLLKLIMNRNRIGTNGCMALATLLQHSCTELQTLHLANNEIDDEGIDALAPALENSSLSLLKLNHSLSVTTKGWRRLASALEAPNTKLKSLSIVGSNIDDEALTVFATSLVNNRTLTWLDIWSNYLMPSFTEIGLEALSKLLCDTSSINSTFLSNHILTSVGQTSENQLVPLLTLNGREDKKEVAMIKILQHNNAFDMTPFFEWEFKVLPLIIDWFETASSITMPDESSSEESSNEESSNIGPTKLPDIGPRKLSSIYQFVRGMPLLYVETRLRKELEDIKAAQIHIEEERARLDQQKLTNEERKRSILERLGHNV